MNTAKNLGVNALNKITPECVNIGKSIKLSAAIVLIMVVLAVILLIAAIVYNYVKKTESSDADIQAANEAKKKKVVGALTITGAVITFLSGIAALWDFTVVSKAANRCIPSVAS